MFNKSAIMGFAVTSVLLATTAVDARTLRLSSVLPEDNPSHISLEFMAERVKELSGGDLQIMIFPNGQLGDTRDSTEQVQGGMIDMTRSSAADLAGFDDYYMALSLPYLFRSETHFHNALSNKEIQDEVFGYTKDKGFVGLMFTYDGTRSFYSNKEIHSPADLKGMKIRVQSSPSALRMVELLGASPTPISFGELYSALQQGVVDGAENNPQALVDMRHGEVSKVYSMDEHGMNPGVVIISSMTWDGLSAEEQGYLRQAADETMSYHRDLYAKQTLEVIKTAQEDLGVKFIEVEKGPFIDAVLPMHDEVAAKEARLSKLITDIKEIDG
ncbi:TRAP transporter substrate-binding protein [Rhodobacteraceae bacterium RKSG542]|uniref:TRAP transporter substrate-binding protein n=1 Tax=Pseudovibrio flavus TaxID=2529854 RepID=UPI0012BB64C3|nr:TRAP transporter substrate-binding protein [Pseudovibrio flavus]MTI17961.1 TRAP transporter substrate-binding protein [Pseudovibrio flavus]